MAFHQQATTLNVAVNASNKALLTIMMSNNVSYPVRQCSLMQSILVGEASGRGTGRVIGKNFCKGNGCTKKKGTKLRWSISPETILYASPRCMSCPHNPSMLKNPLFPLPASFIPVPLNPASFFDPLIAEASLIDRLNQSTPISATYLSF